VVAKAGLTVSLKDAAYEIPLHLNYWFTRRIALHVFPCISQCKMKRPLIGAFLGGNYFLCAKYTNHVPRMLYVKYQSIWTASSWRENLQIFTKFYTSLPLIGPQQVPAPWFSQTWIPIPQIWFLPNLVQISSVVLEKKSFKWKVYAGRQTSGDHYSSLEPSDHVS